MKRKKVIQNKKADSISFLGGNTLNIIIAALCLVILIGVGVSAYTLFKTKTNIKSAEDNLNAFISEFKLFMENTEELKREFLILGPKKWQIMFYEIPGYTPEACKNYNYCVCICKDKDETTCDESNKGICKDLTYKWIGNKKKYKIDEIPYAINLEKDTE